MKIITLDEFNKLLKTTLIKLPFDKTSHYLLLEINTNEKTTGIGNDTELFIQFWELIDSEKISGIDYFLFTMWGNLPDPLKTSNEVSQHEGKKIAIEKDSIIYVLEKLCVSGPDIFSKAKFSITNVLENYFDFFKLNPEIEKPRKNHPQDSSNIHNNMLQDFEKFLKAIQVFNKTIELYPNYAETYYNRGKCFAQIYMYQEAVNDHIKALELDSKFSLIYDVLNPFAYCNLGNAYFNIQRHDKAMECYNKSIDMEPDAETYLNRGCIYSEVKNFEKAISDYNRAIELNPELAMAYYNRARANSALNCFQNAISDYNKAVDLEIKIEQLYFNRGNMYFAIQDYENAANDYSTYLELNSDDFEAYHNRGNSYYCCQKYEEAIADYSKAVELNSEYAIAYKNRGYTYALIQNYEKAIEDYSKAIELNPNYGEAYYFRGKAYSYIGNYEKAIFDYNKSQEFIN